MCEKKEISFSFKGKTNDLLCDNGVLKSTRLVEIDELFLNGEIIERNYDVMLTSCDSSLEHERFNKLIGKKIEVTIKIID